jgi:hypothetical protein
VRWLGRATQRAFDGSTLNEIMVNARYQTWPQSTLAVATHSKSSSGKLAASIDSSYLGVVFAICAMRAKDAMGRLGEADRTGANEIDLSDANAFSAGSANSGNLSSQPAESQCKTAKGMY